MANISVEYQLEEHDLLTAAAIPVEFEQSNPYLGWVLPTFLLLVSGFCLAIYLYGDPTDPPRFLFMAVFIGLMAGALFLFSRPVFRGLARSAMKRHLASPDGQNEFGPRRVTITPDRLVIKDPVSETAFDWKLVKRAVRHGEFLLVFVGPGGGLMHVVPARAFRDEAAADAFLAALNERITPAG
jgi:hypothetical protein